MKKYTIDFSGISDTISMHQCIKSALELGDEYDNSFDTLKIVLSKMENCEIALSNIDVLYSLDIIGINILKVFENAADTNASIIVTIE